eukprot:9132271-Pyramimonas_sp.AAC.1
MVWVGKLHAPVSSVSRRAVRGARSPVGESPPAAPAEVSGRAGSGFFSGVRPGSPYADRGRAARPNA